MRSSWLSVEDNGAACVTTPCRLAASRSTRADERDCITTGDSMSSFQCFVVVENSDKEYASLGAFFCTPTLYLGVDAIPDLGPVLLTLDTRDLWKVLDTVDRIAHTVWTRRGLSAGMEPHATTHKSSIRLQE